MSTKLAAVLCTVGIVLLTGCTIRDATTAPLPPLHDSDGRLVYIGGPTMIPVNQDTLVGTVYVVGAAGSNPHPITKAACYAEPAWSRDGKELFFRIQNKMMSVRFRVTGSEFVPEKPVAMFEGAFLPTTPIRRYDVAPDGRFLMNQAISDAGERDRKIFPSTLRIVLNWTEELHKLLPSAR